MKLACNYDEAQQDNGSCTYAAEGLDCTLVTDLSG